MTQTYHFGAETHLDAGDTSTFVMPSAAVAQVLPLTFIAIILVQVSRKAHKDSDYTLVIALAYMPKLTVLAKI